MVGCRFLYYGGRTHIILHGMKRFFVNRTCNPPRDLVDWLYRKSTYCNDIKKI